MYDQREKVNDPPPGVPKELLDAFERLKWIRRALGDCQSFPEGKLRQSIVEQLQSLMGKGSLLEEEVTKLRIDLKSAHDEVGSLRKRIEKNTQNDSAAFTEDLRTPMLRLRESRDRWRRAGVLMIIILGLIILHAVGG